MKTRLVLMIPDVTAVGLCLEMMERMLTARRKVIGGHLMPFPTVVRRDDFCMKSCHPRALPAMTDYGHH